MKKHFFNILLFVLFTHLCRAQIYFNKTYDFPNTANFSTSVLEIPLSGYILNGSYFSPLGYYGIALVRTDLNGDTIWQKSFVDSFHTYAGGSSHSLITTTDGNYLMCGSRLDTNNNRDAIIVKFTPNGDTLWMKTFGGIGADHANAAIECYEDSGFILIGYTQSFGNGLSDYYMIRTDKNGNQLWYQTFGTSGSEDAVSGIRTLDGGFILAGVKANAEYIIKTDYNGNFLWEKHYTTIQGVAFVTELLDSNLIIAGTKLVTGNDQAYFAETDKLGNIIWSNTYGGAETEILWAIPIVLNDGSIVCSGMQTVGGVPYGYLLKVDNQGNQQWARSYYKNTVIDNYFYDFRRTSDNGFVMVGSANNPNQDHWLVKVDSMGCEIPNCNVGINEQLQDNTPFSVYPNPTSDITTVEIELLETENDYELSIQDAVGREVSVIKLSSGYNILSLETNQFSEGIYFIQIKSNSEIIQSKKLIVIKQ